VAKLPADGRRLVRQQHILQHRQVRHQGEFLEGGLQAVAMSVARLAHDDRPAMDADTPPIGLDRPAEQLDHRRLAGAILAEERMHRPAAHAEARAIERTRGAVSLDDAFELDRGRRVDCHSYSAIPQIGSEGAGVRVPGP
jgi:hypothetical protein